MNPKLTKVYWVLAIVVLSGTAGAAISECTHRCPVCICPEVDQSELRRCKALNASWAEKIVEVCDDSDEYRMWPGFKCKYPDYSGTAFCTRLCGYNR